jgi:bifunctional non-homologous end joining protein LigD
MSAQVVTKLPEGEEWLYEIKFDGYRGLLIKNGERIEIRSRKDKDLTSMYPAIIKGGSLLSADQAVIDGEIVALDAKGRPSFQALQHRGAHPHHRIVFYAFDLLHLEGRNLTGEPLLARRSLLPRVLDQSGLLLSDELPGTAQAIIDAARSFGLEGVVAQRKDSLYEPGERTGSWQKLKLELSQEFVVGGYRPGTTPVDALLVGYSEAV